MNFGEVLASMRKELARPLPARPLDERIPPARAGESRGEIIQFGKVVEAGRIRTGGQARSGRLPAA